MKNKLTHILDWLSVQRIAIGMMIVYFISMIPNIYLSFFARPSGDDYGYSIATHAAWLNTHSLIEVFKAGLSTTKDMCTSWNGDWFTVFLFTWMPEVFVPYSFWIVPMGIMVALTAAMIYFSKEILMRRLHFKMTESIMTALLILIASYQFVPSTAIMLYWYVGVIHYIFPHVVALMLLTFLSKYERTQHVRYIILSAIGTVMIGGSSYYSSMLVFMIYALVLLFYARKNKKLLWIGIPFFTGMVALLLQVLAPGNAARVGDTFGFSVSKAVQTILQALLQGVIAIWGYVKDKTFIFVLLLILGALAWECLLRAEHKFQFKFPLLFVILMYGFYAAMFTPEIYANTDVSLGPATMEFLTFLLVAAAAIIYVEGWLIARLKAKDSQSVLRKEDSYHKYILIPVIAFCILFTLAFRGILGDSVFMRSYEYVASGQAADFKAQIDSQMDILLDDSVKEAYLCPINDNQGPLMHMPVTEDPTAFTNWVVKGFYGKDTVIMKQE